MVFMSGLLFLFLYTAFIRVSYIKTGTVFNPIAYYFVNEILRSVVFLLMYPFNNSLFFPYVMAQVNNLDIAFLKYFCFQFIYSIILFIIFFNGVRKGKTLSIEFDINEDAKKLKIRGMLIIILGFLMGAKYFSLTGGLTSYLSNMSQRSVLSSGTIFYRYYWMVLIGGLAMCFQSARKARQTIVQKIIFLMLTIIIFVSIGMFGGRSPVFFSIIFLIVIDIYLNKKLIKRKIHFMKSVIILLTCIFIFFGFVALREPNAGEVISSRGLGAFINETMITNSTKSLSYLNSVTKYIFIYGSGRFGYGDELWYGKSYLDLIYSVIPRNIFPDKPPVEEGVYIYSIINGLNVKPSVPARLMYPVAWPIDTIGVMYVNFGFLAIIPAAIIMGKIQALFYNSIKKSPSVFIILIWVFQIFSFSLTNSGIFNFAIIFVFMWIIFTALAGMKTRILRRT